MKILSKYLFYLLTNNWCIEVLKDSSCLIEALYEGGIGGSPLKNKTTNNAETKFIIVNILKN